MDLLFLITLVFLSRPLVAAGSEEWGLPPCSATVTTLKELFSGDFSAGATLCVNMKSSSVEFLNYTDTKFVFNAVIYGNGSTVACLPDQNLTGEDFPLTFSNASLVVIKDLNFKDCMRPLQFESIQRLQISSSNFSEFSPGGTIRISNSPIISICDSSFMNAVSEGLDKRKFSGNAGGIAIGYSDPMLGHLREIYPKINITNCIFSNNTANTSDVVTFLDVVRLRIFNQRGGGIAFYFGADNYSGVISIKDCLFNSNVANDSGGGIYMFLLSEAHNISITNTNFIDNKARDGGGLEITHDNRESFTHPNSIRITACNFSRNEGNFGGGYKNIQLSSKSNLNRLSIEGSIFEDNEAAVGAGVYLQGVQPVDNIAVLKRIILEDCIFTNNSAKRGVIFVFGNAVIIRGNTILEKSTGPALRVLGSLVSLEDEIMIRDNCQHARGLSGAIYLSSFGQIVLHSGTNITFLNNNGSEGACIVVKGQLIAAAFEKQLYNPQCFIQYQDPERLPTEWKVKMVFEGNRAKVGPVIFMSNGEICQWNNLYSPFFAENLTAAWTTIMDMRDNYINEEIRPERYIQTGIFTLDLEKEEGIEAYPGQNIRLKATAYDQYHQPTTAFIRIRNAEESNSNTTNTTIFEPSIVPVPLSEGTITFHYLRVDDKAYTEESISFFDPFFHSSDELLRRNLTHDPCWPGYEIKNGKCECSITNEVLQCISNGTYTFGLLLESGIWAAPPEWRKDRKLVTHICPPGYCNCNSMDDDSDSGCMWMYEDSITICEENRRGDKNADYLCGKCNGTYGVGMLSNKCRESGKGPQWLIIPFYFVAVVVVMVMLVKLGIHLPTTLRGFLFYVQISPIAVVYFPDTFKVYGEIMACVASNFALYVPYDFDFHQEMSSLESYGLRFITPVIAFIVVPIAARVRHHRSKYWHGIWTIVLLIYVMAVETSVSLLFCITLHKSDSETVTMWFFDGNVMCNKDPWHIILGILAVASLIFQALLIPFVGASIYHKTLKKKYPKFEKLERVYDVVTEGMKKERKWWPMTELGCRFIFVTAVILSPGNLMVPLALLIAVFVLQTTIHPYKNLLANYMESFLLLWLVVLLSLGNTTALQEVTKNRNLWPLLYIPTLFGAIVLIIHIVLLINKLLSPYKETIKKKLKMKSRDSVKAIQRTVTLSYNVRRYHEKVTFTKTEVGFEDDNSPDQLQEDNSLDSHHKRTTV